MRTASGLMAVALVALAVSATLFLVPVSSPGVQHCGSPAWFLLSAESNTPLVDADGKAVNGWNQARLRRAYDQRCSVVVGRRAIPAGIALVGFWIVALVALVLAWTGRRALRRSTA